MTKDQHITALKNACKNARRFGAMDALRGLVQVQSLISLEYETTGTPEEFRAAERVIAESQQLLESISAAGGSV